MWQYKRSWLIYAPCLVLSQAQEVCLVAQYILPVAWCCVRLGMLTEQERSWTGWRVSALTFTCFWNVMELAGREQVWQQQRPRGWLVLFYLNCGIRGWTWLGWWESEERMNTQTHWRGWRWGLGFLMEEVPQHQGHLDYSLYTIGRETGLLHAAEEGGGAIIYRQTRR